MGSARRRESWFSAPCERPEGARLGVVIARLAAGIRTDVSLAALDSLVTLAAYGSILLLRFDGSVPSHQWRWFGSFVPCALILHLGCNWVSRLYGQLWRQASVEEARRVLLAGMCAVCLLLVPVFPHSTSMPRSVVILGGVVATMLMGAIRFQSRLFAIHRHDDRQAGLRVAVIGAGEAGGALVREMLRSTTGTLRPVAIFDDDPRKWGRAILGIPVMGGVDELPAAVERLDVHQALLAVASADTSLVTRAADAAEKASIPLKVVPGVADLVRGHVSMRDVRDVNILDLLGRSQVETDLDAVRQLLGRRTVLITGAGGSIGSEIARQVAACEPAHLVLLDHDETHLFDVAQALSDPDRVTQVLCDVSDASGLEQVFQSYLPDVVFHAAAHKHVPILERHACQAVTTNVFGTLNVVESAARAGVERLVFISTDKAVRPESVMGASKWLGEQVVLNRAPAGGRYCAVRFGNVLGSRGSVIPTFSRQIAAGGPVTVTDHRMNRFFMSIREAVQLVLQAAAFARGGEIFMLDMGEPVNILDLAKRMIRLSGYEVGTDIAIRITGVRPGEKLSEQLSGSDEEVDATPHPSIQRLRPVKLPDSTLRLAIERLWTESRLHHDDEAKVVLLALSAQSSSSDPDEELLDALGADAG